jgi:hypothetical protein
MLSKTLSGVGCVMAALLTSSSVRYLAARGSETFISVWFSAKYCAMIPPLSVKADCWLNVLLLTRIPVFVTKAFTVNFKSERLAFSEIRTRMISTASHAIRKIILAVKHFSWRVFENAKGSSYIESISAQFPTTAEEKVQRPAMYSPAFK